MEDRHEIMGQRAVEKIGPEPQIPHQRVRWGIEAEIAVLETKAEIEGPKAMPKRIIAPLDGVPGLEEDGKRDEGGDEKQGVRKDFGQDIPNPFLLTRDRTPVVAHRVQHATIIVSFPVLRRWKRAPSIKKEPSMETGYSTPIK